MPKDALCFQTDGFFLTAFPHPGQQIRPLAAQVRGHFPGKQFDQPGSLKRDRIALVGKLGIRCVEVGAFEAFGHEHVCCERTGTADHRLVVAGRTGIGVHSCKTLEGLRCLAAHFCRHDSPRRVRPACAIQRGELGLEQLFSKRLQHGDGIFARLRQGVDIDVFLDGPFAPGCGIGKRRCRQGDAEDESRDREPGFACHAVASLRSTRAMRPEGGVALPRKSLSRRSIDWAIRPLRMKSSFHGITSREKLFLRSETRASSSPSHMPFSMKEKARMAAPVSTTRLGSIIAITRARP